MYLHLGRDYVVNSRDVIGIFDMDTTTISPRGRTFLDYNQKNGAVVALSEDIPHSFLVSSGPLDTVYLSGLSSRALERRLSRGPAGE